MISRDLRTLDALMLLPFEMFVIGAFSRAAIALNNWHFPLAIGV
jgi:hypothetical protein